MEATSPNPSRIERWITELLSGRRDDAHPYASESYESVREAERAALDHLYGHRSGAVAVSRREQP